MGQAGGRSYRQALLRGLGGRPSERESRALRAAAHRELEAQIRRAIDEGWLAL